MHTNVHYKKGQCGKRFLRRLASFNICSKFLHMFYQSVEVWGVGGNKVREIIMVIFDEFSILSLINITPTEACSLHTH